MHDPWLSIASESPAEEVDAGADAVVGFGHAGLGGVAALAEGVAATVRTDCTWCPVKCDEAQAV